MQDSAPTPRARRTAVRLIRSPVQRFIATETSGGIVLLGGLALALGWANSPWAEGYHHLLDQHIRIDLGVWSIDENVHFWLSDALMTVFFFVVGLEVKREVVAGELAHFRRAVIPIAGAIGGMALPALIYVAMLRGGPGSQGWGVPVATDIAFALGVLMLAGSRVPFALKMMLLALAITDDIGGILIIAIFYSDGLALGALALAGAILLLCYVLRRAGVWYLPVYVALGVVGWVATLESGIHPTIFGVALGLLTPWQARRPVGAIEVPAEASPLERLEKALGPVSTFLIAPLFAFANAGVAVDAGILGEALRAPVAHGIFLGLILGKPLGILIAIRVAVAFGARLPEGVGWGSILGLGVVAGIGFTVALFVAGLSFEDAQLLTDAKLGILAASLVAGVLGWTVLRLVHAPRATV
ncbi:MAG: Na+/H+ antiporter NhaA [Chloroflexi bacterium]|nr:MAG: Na+/H+ antiporter NhaA [Chloroflexota bacterium]